MQVEAGLITSGCGRARPHAIDEAAASKSIRAHEIGVWGVALGNAPARPPPETPLPPELSPVQPFRMRL